MSQAGWPYAGLSKWRKESNPVKDFVKDRTIRTSEGWAATAALHRNYLAWHRGR